MALPSCKFIFLLFVSLLCICCSRAQLNDINPPATVFPTNPTTPSPITNPPIIIPPPNPTIIPPVTIPPTTPVIVPPNEPGPGTVVPVTNPVTQYPVQGGYVPVVAPPTVTTAPAVPGQSWCVARSGASDAAIQSALDYACGIGGADCSQIQQGGPCYIPNSLQNHASYAFNSYYQKNPSASSCDFGGAANIVAINPSSGSCSYPSSSSSVPTPTGTITPTPTTQTVTPTGTTQPTPSTPTVTPPATVITPTGGGVFGSATPPIFNPANPTSTIPTNPASGVPAIYGFDGTPTDLTPSMSSRLKIFVHSVKLVVFIAAGILVLEM